MAIVGKEWTYNGNNGHIIGYNGLYIYIHILYNHWVDHTRIITSQLYMGRLLYDTITGKLME